MGDTTASEATYTVVVPHTDGEIDAVLGRLEELLLQIRAWDEDEPPEFPLPEPLAGGVALDALNDLQGHIGAFDREPPAVTLVAPDGRFELVPLLVVELPEPTRLRTIVGMGQLVAAGDPAEWPGPGLSIVREVLEDFDMALGGVPRTDDQVKTEVLADARGSAPCSRCPSTRTCTVSASSSPTPEPRPAGC